MSKNRLALFSLAFSTMLLVTACSKISFEVSGIKQVIDGDTVELVSGNTVRLVQIDTPELSTNECYAQESKQALIDLLSSGNSETTSTWKSDIAIEYDEKQDKMDKYQRELVYLIASGINLNIELVRLGFAAPYFYESIKGVYAEELLEAAEYAKSENLGIWAACPGFIYNPDKAIETGIVSGITSSSNNEGDNFIIGGSENSGNCSPDYRECVPPYPPDYDCSQLRDLGVIHVIGADPHRLDRDGDGVACESNAP